MFPQVATVSYPTPRALNPAAFQTAATVASVPPVPPATPNPSPKQRVFTGTVTKVHDNFGFVDEDVFFQTRWGNWFVQEILNLCEKYTSFSVCMIISELLTAVQYEPFVLFKSLAMSWKTFFPTIFSFIHVIVCLMMGPHPLPKWAFHRVQSSASSSDSSIFLFP